jgi:ribosomal protein L40E
VGATAIEALRQELERRGVRYVMVSPRQVNYEVDGMSWAARSSYDGDTVHVESYLASPHDVLLATANVAGVQTFAHDAVGHTVCLGCGGTVGVSDQHCRHCGARLRRRHD